MIAAVLVTKLPIFTLLDIVTEEAIKHPSATLIFLLRKVFG